MDAFCNTIEEFATQREIVSLLAKFEVKYQSKVRQALDGERKVPEKNPELAELIPVTFRFRKSQSDKRRVTALTNFLVKRISDNAALEAFVDKVTGIIRAGHFTFEKPHLIPQLKKQNIPLKKATYRPLSAYTDLTTKVILGLEAGYLSHCFDSLFHDEMLAYRLPRTYHGQPDKVTTNKDAVPSILEYLEAHKDASIYVTECDIQKFFDILQHDVILECFDSLAREAAGLHPDFSPAGARSLLADFLSSYSFYNDVFRHNKEKGMESGFWKTALGDRYDDLWTYEFGWIRKKDAERISTREDYSDIGIPQGASLSTVITNIVLQSVDRSIICSPDRDRLFIRYCDDIVLMHTDSGECNRLKDIYAASLSAHKLIYHPFEDIRNHPKTNSGRDDNSYWNIKSKAPFLWNRASGNSAEWIGFLGFEISRSGDVRMRRSSVRKKSEKIAKDIRQICGGHDSSLQERHLRKFKKMSIAIPSGAKFESNLLSSHKGITTNRWTARQIKGLERTRRRYWRKFRKDTASASEAHPM